MRIVHFADLHLDRPLVGLPPEIGRRRRQELRAALRRCLAAAREHNADVVTVGGDLWEDEHVTPDTRRFVASELRDLARPVVMICGNHDPYLPGGNYARTEWPSNVAVCRAETPTEYRFGNVSLWAVSWLGGHLDLGSLQEFAPRADGRTNLLLVHGTALGSVGAVYPNAAAAPFDPERVARAGFRLCLAGHIHCAAQIDGVVYPGSPEPLGWAEMGRHTVTLVEVADGTVRATPVDINERRYVSRDVDCDDALSSAAVERRIQAALTDDDPASTYLRLILRGQVASECDVDTAALQQMSQGQYAALVIRDETVPEYDLESFERQSTATGHFVRSIRARIAAAADAPERERLELALRFGLHALHGRKELIRVG